MEPFRPVVDRVVVELVSSIGPDAAMDQGVRAQLTGCLLSRIFMHNQQRTVLDALNVMSASLVDAMSRSEAKLSLPQEFAHAA